jgi:NAD+-dependent protein deacetylase sirtuin 6
MSAGYASRLSEYPNKGVCGLPENFDSARSLKVKMQQLVQLVKESRHFVVLTGAGISTSAGIPDFRGPKGVWTLENEKNRQSNNKKRKRPYDKKATTNEAAPTIDFSKATPTMTHQAIVKLAQDGKLKYCITQNVDGLHKRSGLSRDILAVLHGCAFTEKCNTCGTEYFRDFDIGGMSFKPTGRNCIAGNCTGPLHDTLLDWEDPLPEEDFERSQEECEKADLVLCLGTSLRIEPAGSLPTFAKKFVIVNLQPTPKDELASLIIKATVDEVMGRLMDGLGYDQSWNKGLCSPVERIWTPPSSK